MDRLPTTGSRPVDQKQRIRRTAAALFAANGYDATGIQEISEAVGLGRGALYHHIGSKEQLLFDVITPGVIEVVGAAEAVLSESSDAPAKVRRLSRITMGAVADNLPGWRVFFREMDALDGPLRAELIAWRQRFEDVWSAVIAQGVAEGEFRALDPIAIKGILGMHNYAHVWLRPQGRLGPDEVSDVFCDLLLAGLRASGAAAEAQGR